MKSLALCIAILWPLFSMPTEQTKLPRLSVSENSRFLVQEDGTPFFYLADTAWELFHRCNREQADRYLKKRASQGFNVIQAVALAELDGLNTPNPYGHNPLIEADPNRPNEAYFEHVDYVIRSAERLGLYIALLPTWGDKLNTKSWGVGPEVLHPSNAFAYGKWLGKRYKDQQNIIWVIGGDRNPREESQDVEVWNQMALGVIAGVGDADKALMSFHPQPTELGGSSTWFHEEDWLDFNMHQTGHCPNRATYDLISHDYALMPTKPVLDGEPLYEDHPNCFNLKEKGYSTARDIRRIMYQNVFAGAMGQTYGCHDVWQMYSLDKEPINHPPRPWTEALDLPMATQVKHLKNLMLSRPYLSRVPAQEMIVNEGSADFSNQPIATRDANGSYAMVYLPTGQKLTLDLSVLRSSRLKAWWYDPRTGTSIDQDVLDISQQRSFVPPSQGLGNDWVLVLDAVNAGFCAPARL
ncbi:MAG: glycoside hydrolase family 140 protein [Bacteroidota bacterium]